MQQQSLEEQVRALQEQIENLGRKRRKFKLQDKKDAIACLLLLNDGHCLITGELIAASDGTWLEDCEFHHADGNSSNNDWTNIFPCHRLGHGAITKESWKPEHKCRIERFQAKLREFKFRGSGKVEDFVDYLAKDAQDNPDQMIPVTEERLATAKARVSQSDDEEDEFLNQLGLKAVEEFWQNEERLEPLIKIPKHKPNHVYRWDPATKTKKRFYLTTDGSEYASVTTILEQTKPQSEKDALNRWRDKVGADEAEKVSTDATTRGTWLHSMIEAYLEQRELPEIIEEYAGFWQSIQPVLPRITSPLLIEAAVWHPKGYAGTLDCLAFLDGELALLDWKTSGKPKKPEYIQGYFLQAGAYSQAVNWMYEEYGVVVSKAAIVVTLPNTEAQVFELDSQELEAYQHGFNLRLRQMEAK